MAEMENNVVEETTEVATPSIEELQAKIQALTEEKDKLKQVISASNSDASKRKKEALEWQEKYKATLTEQERATLEAKQREETLTSELQAYKERERISSYRAKLLSAGYDDATATTMASALPEGIADSFFESQKNFLEAQKQTVKTQLINSQPGLSMGMPPVNTTETNEDNEMRKWFGLK